MLGKRVFCSFHHENMLIVICSAARTIVTLAEQMVSLWSVDSYLLHFLLFWFVLYTVFQLYEEKKNPNESCKSALGPSMSSSIISPSLLIYLNNPKACPSSSSVFLVVPGGKIVSQSHETFCWSHINPAQVWGMFQNSIKNKRNELPEVWYLWNIWKPMQF